MCCFMKRYLYFLLSFITCSLAFFSCTDNLEDPEQGLTGKTVKRTFSAEFVESKTALTPGDSRYVLTWREEDKVGFVSESANTTSTAYSVSMDGKKAYFDANLPAGEQVYAYYPSTLSPTVTFSDTGAKMVFSVPSSQTGMAADATYIIAKDNEGSLHFNNVTSIFAFSFSKTMYPEATRIKIESLDKSKSLAGKASVVFDQYGDAVITVDKNLSDISLDLTSAISSPICISVLPQVYSGIKFTVYKGNSVLRTTTCDNTINAQPGTVVNFGALVDHLDEFVYMDTETFTSSAGTGGRDSNYGVAGNEILTPDSKTDNSGWEMMNCYEAKNCIRVGDNLTRGYAITPALGISSGRATVTFSTARGGSNAYFLVFVEGKGVINKQIFQTLSSGWKEHTLYISGADSDTRIRFETYVVNTGSRAGASFYIDDIKVIDGCSLFDYVYLQEGFYHEVEAEQTKLQSPLSYGGSIGIRVNTVSASNQLEFADAFFPSKTSFAVTFPANEGRDSRKNYIDIYNSNAGIYLSVYIKQLGKTALFAKSDKLSFPGEGGTRTLKLDWWNFAEGAEITASSSNPQFSFTVNPADSSVTVTAKANETIDPVDAKMTVEMTDGKRTRSVEVALSQEHGVIDQTLAFDPVSLSITVGTEYTLPVLSGAMTPVTYSIASDDAANPVATIDSETGELTLLGVDGTATVTASAEASEFYHSASATYTLIVTGNQKTQKIKFVDAQDETVTVSSLLVYAGAGIDGAPIFSDYQLPELSGAETSVTYSISNSDPEAAVATINPETGVLQLTGKTGTATITAVAAETKEWTSATASYTVEVKAMIETTLAYNTKNGVVAKSVTETEFLFETDYYNFSGHVYKGATEDVNYGVNGIKLPKCTSVEMVPVSTVAIKYIEMTTANQYPLNLTDTINISDSKTNSVLSDSSEPRYYVHEIVVDNPISKISFNNEKGARVKQIRILYYPTK